MNTSPLPNHFSGSLKVRNTGAVGNSSQRIHFDRDRLPPPTAFYSDQFPRMKKTRRGWVIVNCCFHHPDRHPSLAINLNTGGFSCFSCGAKGGDVVDFVIQLDGVDFKTAARQLGAWRGLAQTLSQRQERERQERRRTRLTAASIRLERAERECRFSIRAEIHELERLQAEAKARLSALGCTAANGTNNKIEFCWQVLSWTTDELRRAIASYYVLAFGAAKARAEFAVFPERRAAAISAALDRGCVVDDDGFVVEVPLA